MVGGMNGYSDRPLAVGTLIGYKWLMVDSEGDLYGPTFPQRVDRGENVASCQQRGLMNMWGGQAHESFFPDKRFTNSLPSRRFIGGVADPLVFHSHTLVPQAACGCGYWVMNAKGARKAMTYGQPNSNTLLCAVEGYGRCIIGPLGFRAQKMRVLAVCAQRPPNSTGPKPQIAARMTRDGRLEAQVVTVETPQADWERLAQRAACRYGVDVINTRYALMARFPSSDTEEMLSLPTGSSDPEPHSQPG